MSFIAMDSLPGVYIMDNSDITDLYVQERIYKFLHNRKADVVMR